MHLALVVPHIFFQQDLMPNVIFSPGELALSLAQGLAKKGHQVTVFSPGPIAKLLPPGALSTSTTISLSTSASINLPFSSNISNIASDLSLFKKELAARGDSFLELLKKHPLTFITLARQVQTELIARAISLANQGEFDLVHIWCNEEEQGLVMQQFCQKPVVFNHHEPFNFLNRYRAIFPKYPQLNWISFSLAQRQTFGLPESQVNWVGNVYHGLSQSAHTPSYKPGEYLLYAGRIIRPKGVHYAIAAVKRAGLKLKIAGKHYAGHNKDKYWQEFIQPEIDGAQIEYLGFVKSKAQKQALFSKAQALLIPSTWQEPFGLVMVEALACATPVIGFNQGAIPEVVESGTSGFVADYQVEDKHEKQGRLVEKKWTDLQKDKNFTENLENLVEKIGLLEQLDRRACRQRFEQQFTLEKMVEGYEGVYGGLL